MEQHISKSLILALTWLNNHLRYFDLGDMNQADNSTLYKQQKRLSELAMVYIVLKRNKIHATRPELKAIATHLKTIYKRPHFFRGITRDLHNFPFYLTMYNALLEIGVELSDYKEVLQRIVNINYMDCIERTAWNQIDFKYQLELGGFKHNMASYTDMYQLSSLYYLPNLVHVRTIDIYAITHIIFHLTDFGSKNIDAILGNKKDDTAAYIAFLTSKYAYIEDWDLLAELLICCHNLNHRTHPLYTDCWYKLLNAQQDDGSFTSTYIKDVLFKDESNLNTEKQFLVNYHPTIVSLFACALESEFLTQQKYNYANC